MPTYDYKCRACGSQTEVIHSMLDDGPSVCERCGGVLRRVIYPSGIIFKGSGFYRNDSRASSSTSSGDGESGSSSGSDGSTSKSDATKSGSDGSTTKSDGATSKSDGASSSSTSTADSSSSGPKTPSGST